MLRINLLPIRQLKKRAKAKNQIAGFCAVFLCLLAILGFVVFLQMGKITSINTTITGLTAEQKRLAPQIAAVDKLKKDREEIDRKIQVINQLKAESSITVHILDEVAKAIDNTRMWLTSLDQQSSSLTLTGIALDNQTIAQFMDKLKMSPYIQDVNLANASLKRISDKNLKEFTLHCAVSLPKKTQAGAKEK